MVRRYSVAPVERGRIAREIWTGAASANGAKLAP